MPGLIRVSISMIRASIPFSAALWRQTAMLILCMLTKEVHFVDDNFSNIPFYAVFVGIITVGETSFNGDLAAFAQVSFGKFGLLFPKHDLVPGHFIYFFAFAVPAITVSGEADLRELLLGFGYF